jgi:hypothetical protein
MCTQPAHAALSAAPQPNRDVRDRAMVVGTFADVCDAMGGREEGARPRR